MLPSLFERRFINDFFRGFDEVFIDKKYWYDPSKYELVPRKDYKEKQVKALEDYKERLQEKIKYLDKEIKKIRDES